MTTPEDNPNKMKDDRTENGIIAEFMGFKRRIVPPGYHATEVVVYDEPKGYTYEVEGLKYDTSWDWLMPVVEKINDTPTGKWNSECSIFAADVMYNLSELNIKKVHSAAVEFIKFYNTTKQ